MTTKYYLTNYPEREIVPVEVERETARSLWIKGKRVSRFGKRYFDKEGDAVSFVRSELSEQIEWANDTLTQAKSDLAAFNKRYPRKKLKSTFVL